MIDGNIMPSLYVYLRIINSLYLLPHSYAHEKAKPYRSLAGRLL